MWAHATCRSCLTLTFYPGHEFGLFAGPWIKTITFSGRHRQNVFIRSYDPLKHGFHDSEKITFSTLQNAEREFEDSAVNVFSGRPNARSDLTRYVVRVWPWRFTLATNLVFSHDLELKQSLFQVAIKEKMCSHEATYPWSMSFTSRKKSHIQPSKMQNVSLNTRQ